MKESLIRLVIIYCFIIPFAVVMWVLNKNNIIDVNILIGYGIFLYAFTAGGITTTVSLALENI